MKNGIEARKSINQLCSYAKSSSQYVGINDTVDTLKSRIMAYIEDLEDEAGRNEE